MESSTVFFGCFTGLIAILLGICASFTARGRGSRLLNTNIFLTRVGQTEADRKAEYKSATIDYGSMSVTSGLLTLNIFTSWSWVYVVMWIFIGLVVIYIMVDTIKKCIKK